MVSYSLTTFLPGSNESRSQDKLSHLGTLSSHVSRQAQKSSHNLSYKHDTWTSVLLLVSVLTSMKGPLAADMMIIQKQESLPLQFRHLDTLANGWTRDHSEIKPWASHQRDRLQVQLDSDTLFQQGWGECLKYLSQSIHLEFDFTNKTHFQKNPRQIPLL